MTREEATAVILGSANTVLGMLPPSLRLDVARAVARALFVIAQEECERQSGYPVARLEHVKRHPKDDR